MPASISGRSRRCSSFAARRLASRTGSSAAAFVQRSTPPAASRRETAATRNGQVSQKVVGNGSPAESYGLCSVTAGLPNGQRRATARNARGSRPIWRATTTRSAATARQASAQPLPPLVDPLDDEQVLAGADIAESARLTGKRGHRGRRAQPLLECRLLPLETMADGLPLPQLPARIDVRAQRAVVEQRDEDERADGKPAAKNDRTRDTATLLGHPRDLRAPTHTSCNLVPGHVPVPGTGTWPFRRCRP